MTVTDRDLGDRGLPWGSLFDSGPSRSRGRATLRRIAARLSRPVASQKRSPSEAVVAFVRAWPDPTPFRMPARAKLAFTARVPRRFFCAAGGARDVGSGGGIMAQATGCSTRVSILMALRNDPGDQSAWSAFVNRYGPQIHAWCLRWKLQDADAQDVTQMVLLKLVRHLPDFAYDPSRSFRGWLRTLTAHSWSDFIRDQVRGVRGAADSVVADRLDTIQARVDLVRHLEETYDRELLELAMAEVRERVERAHLGGVPPDGHRGGRARRRWRRDWASAWPRSTGRGTWCRRSCARPWPPWIPSRKSRDERRHLSRPRPVAPIPRGPLARRRRRGHRRPRRGVCRLPGGAGAAGRGDGAPGTPRRPTRARLVPRICRSCAT